jgi:Leucine-rich repeat (LRR) protein
MAEATVSTEQLVARLIEDAAQSNVAELDLRGLGVARLPPGIGNCTALERLDLTGNALASLPAELFELPRLERLRLTGNHLAELPDDVGRLASLQQLNVSFNALRTLPNGVAKLRNLRALDVSGNPLRTLPAATCQFPRLTDLDITSCGLTELPPEIAELQQLEVLAMGNALGSPRLELEYESSSPVLDALGRPDHGAPIVLYDDYGNPERNHFKELPSRVCALRTLKTLWVQDAGIQSLPAAIGNLKSLEGLDLEYNEIRALPPTIGRLKSLTRLNLRSNQLRRVPAELSKLKELDYLRLERNMLASWPDVTGCRNLRTLDLDNNEIAHISPDILSLAKLKVLYLRENRLTRLPPAIGHAQSLETIWLEGNQLQTLPRELASLEHLNDLRLGDNPLDDPLSALAASGLSDLKAYLRNLGADVQAQYEAKMLMVGEGNVGKSSLVAALRGDPFEAGRLTTHGIETRVLSLNHPSVSGETILLNTWDFGGQEVYRITHQFFFSRRALYLLVWWPREGREELEGWCRRIKLRVGDEAKIIVVATHADERRPELDYPSLERSFAPLVAGNHAVDSATGTGLEALKQMIADEAAALPQMGEPFPSAWSNVRADLTSMKAAAPQISYDDYAAVCHRHRVGDEDALALARMLNRLGLIVYHHDVDSLRDIVVLEPEWLTKAMSYVLDDRVTEQDNGILDHRRLGEIWKDYDRRFHPYFLRLMESFDVSYEIQDEEHKSLVAQLVPFVRPTLPQEFVEPARTTKTLRLICRLEEPVDGLIAWLTVRNHGYSTGTHWRDGVLLENRRYGSVALLEMTSDAELALTVRGTSPDGFFSYVRDTVEHLIEVRWPNLGYELIVPCPTVHENGTACDGQFHFQDLLRWREKEMGAFCQRCDAQHDVSLLLTGFAVSDVPVTHALDALNKKVDAIQADVGTVDQKVEAGNRVLDVVAERVKLALRAVNQEVPNCPRLFLLREGRRPFFQPWHQGHELVLWCEHPGHEHPWDDATYTFHTPKKWAADMAPYAAFVVKTLRLVVPIAGGIAGVAVSEQDLKQYKSEIDLMKTLVDKLPMPPTGAAEDGSGLTYAEGAALRAFSAKLFELDRAKRFGDLRRVQIPSGDYVWICPEHYPEYDRGLPEIPQAA